MYNFFLNDEYIFWKYIYFQTKICIFLGLKTKTLPFKGSVFVYKERF